MQSVLPHVTMTTPTSRESVASAKIPVVDTMKNANWPSQSRMSSQDQRGANRPLGKVSKNAARQGNSTKKLIPEMVKARSKKGLGDADAPSKTPVMPVNAMVTKINEVSSPSSSVDVPHSRQKISAPITRNTSDANPKMTVNDTASWAAVRCIWVSARATAGSLRPLARIWL